MKTLQDFSKYINELSKEKKYDNILIYFKDISSNFTKDEIETNEYLVSNLLTAYRQTKQLEAGWQFIKDYDINPFKGKKLVLSAYGWLINESLKTEKTTDIQFYIEQAKLILQLLNLSNEYDKNLFCFIFSNIIRIEKKKENIESKSILSILKSLDFKTNSEAQKIFRSNDFILPGILDILRKSGHIKWGESIFNFLQIKLEETSTQILNSYGWLLYSKLKLELKDSDDETHEEKMDSFIIESKDIENTEENSIEGKNEIVDQIINILHLFQKDEKYSPFSRLFQLIIKTEKTKANPNWKFLLDFITLFDVQTLSLSCESFEFLKNGKTKTIELASDKELWYSTKITGLYKTGEFQQCIEFIDKAQKDISKFHYSNDLWFLWKTGLCKKEFGDIQEAIVDIEKVYKKKQEWFVQKELADLYFKSGRIDDALNIGIEACLNFGDKEKKDSLYFLLGEIFEANSNFENAYKHYLLAKLIRESQEWYISKKYFEAVENPIFVQYLSKNLTLKLLFTDLSKYWKNLRNKEIIGSPNITETTKDGIIKMFNTDKGFGFIEGFDKIDYYFKIRDFKNSKNLLTLNLKVTFEYEASSDEKRGKAINIRIKQNN